MNFLYLDTVSTTGVWLWKNAATDSNQPHLIRIATALYEDDAEHPMDNFVALIKREPDWPDITSEGYDRHHIEDADLRFKGVPLKSIISRLTNLLASADALVMHNAQFHHRMLWRAYYDAGLSLPDKSPRAVCTMLGAKDAIRSAKWISLAEAHRYFKGEALELPAAALARGEAMIQAVRGVHQGIMKAGVERGHRPPRVMGNVVS